MRAEGSVIAPERGEVIRSVQKVTELFAAAGMTELPQGLGLDLADTFTGDVELFANLLEGP